MSCVRYHIQISVHVVHYCVQCMKNKKIIHIHNEYPIPITVHKGKKITSPRIIWDQKERKMLEGRILKLRDDQLGALAKICGGFADKDIPAVVKDIREFAAHSGHLPIILEEAESKENILWWVGYFEHSV